MKSVIRITALLLALMLAVFPAEAETENVNPEQTGIEQKTVRIAVHEVKGQTYEECTIISSLIKSFNDNLELIKGNEYFRFEVDNISSSDFNENQLSNYNVLVVSGTYDSNIASVLGLEGCSAVENFVKAGGGYIGIGAGAAMAVEGYDDPTSALFIVDGRVLEPQNMDRGVGQVQLSIGSNPSHPILQGYKNNLTVNYEHGPVILKAENPVIEDFDAIATFSSDVCENPNVIRGIMPGKAAMITSGYFDGRCVLFGFNPETTPGLERLFAQTVMWAAGIDGYTITPKPQSINQMNNVGIWLWGSTVFNQGAQGAEIITEQLKEYGITDIYLLVKGTSGVVNFESQFALKRNYPDRDILQEVIDAAHSKGIRVHAWFCVNSDNEWGIANPTDVMYHLGQERYDNASSLRVSPMSPAYRQYTKNLIQEVLENYDVDGIHLDYIRYPHIVLGHNPEYEMAEAERRNIDMARIKQYLNETYYNTPTNPHAIFEAFDRGDPDVVGIVNVRKDAINSFANEIKEVIKNYDSSIIYSAALMPEGAYNSNYLVSQSNSRTFQEVHYAQCYATAKDIYDYVIPMLYWENMGKSTQWLSVLYKNTIDLYGDGRVSAGLQAYSPVKSAAIAETVNYVKKYQQPSVTLFRYGSCAFSKVEVVEGGKVMNVTLTNALKPDNSQYVNISKVEITVTGGFQLKRVLETENLDNAQITTTADGQTVVITGTPCMVENATAKISLEVEGIYNPAVEPAQVRFYVTTANNPYFEVRGYNVHYQVPGEPEPSNNAALSALALSAGELSPQFEAEIYAYTATVANSVDSITVAAVAEDQKATVTVNGGDPLEAVSLNVGENTITVIVTAEDGATRKIYTIKVTRQSPPEESTPIVIPPVKKNNPPVLMAIENKIVNEGKNLTFTVNATDADGDSLTYSAANLPEGATFDPNTRVFSWTPGYGQSGTYSVTFIVTDGADFASNTVEIEVRDFIEIEPEPVTSDIIEPEPGTRDIIEAELRDADIKLAIDNATSDVARLKVQSVEKTKKVTVSIPVGQFDTAENKQIKKLEIDMGIAIVSINYDILKGGDGTTPSALQLSVEKVDISTLPEEVRNMIGNNTVYDINMSRDGKDVCSFKNADVVVSVNYTLKPYEDPNKVVVYYIGDSGELKIVTNGRYNAATGKVEFKPVHLSKYVTVYADVTFTDIVDISWAKESIEALAAREVIKGVGDGTFRPHNRVTRAEFIKMLMMAFELAEDDDAMCSFSDVEQGAWYYDSIAAAQKLGIVKGRPDGTFGVNDEITRQDMAVMLYRMAMLLKHELGGNENILTFIDEADISEYALEAVTAMQSAGIIKGVGGGRFEPKNNATRAEAAVIIYRLFKIL